LAVYTAAEINQKASQILEFKTDYHLLAERLRAYRQIKTLEA
jgi:hypothetical protein